jgi:phosphopantetheinyl transferase
VHVWIAPAGDEPRSAAHNLLLDLASTLVRSPVLRHEPNGKPCVDGLAVSISHSRELVVVAASQAGPVGVDVEDHSAREVSALARRWFDPEELAWMRAQADELTAFLRLWTAKEAVGKALGQGLRNAGLRRRMPLPISPDGPALRAGLVAGEAGLAVLHAPAEQAVLAVAAGAELAELVLAVHHGTALRRTVRSRTSFPVVVRGN